MGDRVGQRLGNYRLIRLLGQGGFADVYLAEHIHLETLVAVKLLSMHLTGDNIDYFRTEARTIAHLVHPNIVRVLDFGVEDNTPYLAMDYAPNGSLRHRHPKGSRLPLNTIVAYVKQVASALQHAHEKKLIHRDIKPENMLLDENHQVLLSDFGIAQVAQSSRNLNTQEMAGTMAYIAPEQILGKPRLASDQYALGVVVYEWISGDRPFHGSLTELMGQHLYVPPPPLHEKIPMVSPEVEQVVLKALEKDSHERFISVQAFATSLEQACHAEPLPLLNPEPSPQAIALLSSPQPPMAPAPFSRQSEGVTSFMKTGLHTDDNHVAEPRAIEESPNRKLISSVNRDGKAQLWHIGKYQGIAMVLGPLLSGIIVYAIDVAVKNFDILTRPFNSALFSYFALANIVYCLARPIALCLAARYGPWVGLSTAGVGGFLADCFAGYVWNGNWNWNWPLGSGLTGFIAGLALLKTQGRYKDASSIALAAVLAALGEVIGLIPPTYGRIWFWHASLPDATIDFLVQALPSIIFILLLLPILLVVSEPIAEHISLLKKRK